VATSPTVRQRELGKRLRELRNQHGLTVEEVADKLLCSATKISRLETGARRSSFRDVRDFCELYGLDEPTSTEFMSLAREARQRAVGGPAIMAAQLDKVLQAERRGKVTVQVVSFDFGAHAAQDSNFILFEFADNTNQSPVVSVEGLTGMQYLEKPADITRYREAIECLRDSALSPRDSIALVAEKQRAYANRGD